MSDQDTSLYVHAEFYQDEQEQLDEIRTTKEDYGVSWKQMLEFGMRYIEAVEEAETLHPDLLFSNGHAGSINATDTPEEGDSDS